MVICNVCKKEFSYHRSTSSLTYHLNKSSTAVGPSSAASVLRQTTLTKAKCLSKNTSEKLTNTIAKWIAVDCRPISTIEDKGLMVSGKLFMLTVDTLRLYKEASAISPLLCILSGIFSFNVSCLLGAFATW